MSNGRPKNNTPISGNYPAGSDPWSGQPKRVAGAGYATPKTPAAAELLNDLVGSVQDTQLGILNMTGQHAAMNWPSSSCDVVVGGSLPSYLGMTWDVKYGRWLIYGSRTGVANAGLAYASRNGGRTWFAMGGANPSSGPCDGFIAGAVFNPTTGKLAVCTYQGSAADPAALTDEESRLHIGASTGRVVGIAYNGLYVFAGRNNSTTPLIQTSPLGSSGVWSNRVPGTIAAPSTWGTATDYSLASSGSQLIIATIGVLNYGEYMYSADGISWTTAVHTFASGWYNTGLCWAGDRWILSQTNGTNSQVLVSTDGINWSAGTTILNVYLGGVAAIGQLIFAPVWTHLDLHGAWSIDSGQTWQFGGQYDVSQAISNTPDRAYTNGAQFATLSTTRASFSNFMCVPVTQY